MPPRTANLVPVIVYVSPDTRAKLEALADEHGSSASAEARRLLLAALR